MPEIQPGFYLACILFGFSQTAATLFLSKALHIGNISMVVPLWRTSLIWLVVVSFFTLGETPSAMGLAGIGVTLAGVYVLNISRAKISPWEPPPNAVRGPMSTVRTSTCWRRASVSVIGSQQRALIGEGAGQRRCQSRREPCAQ